MVVVTNMELDILPGNSAAVGEETEVQTNWATNIVYSTNVIHEVKSTEEIQSLLQSKELEKVTAFGTGHTFNFLADNLHNRLSLRLLTGVSELNSSARTVVVDAGIRYDQLCPFLESKGFALHNLASLTDLSIAGAISTAAHGSGTQNRSLATAVSALEMVTGDGDIVSLSRHSHGDAFLGAVVGLGALGIITRLTLDLEPSFSVRQFVYENLPLAQLKEHFDAIMNSGFSVSLFTDWQHSNVYQMWIKLKIQDNTITTNESATLSASLFPPEELFGATLQTQNLDLIREMSPQQCTEQLGKLQDDTVTTSGSVVGEHGPLSASLPPPQKLFGATLQTQNLNLIRGMSPQQCTEQLGIAGPWYQILPHFRAGFLPAVGAELQTEYFVPRRHAVAAISAVEKLREKLSPLLLESEIRAIAADELWLSMCYGRDSVAIHFCWRPDWIAVERLLPDIESALAPFDPRPHWGKLFVMAPELLRSKYERLDDFIALAAKHDPRGRFRNEFLDTNVFTR